MAPDWLVVRRLVERLATCCLDDIEYAPACPIGMRLIIRDEHNGIGALSRLTQDRHDHKDQ